MCVQPHPYIFRKAAILFGGDEDFPQFLAFKQSSSSIKLTARLFTCVVCATFDNHALVVRWVMNCFQYVMIAICVDCFILIKTTVSRALATLSVCNGQRDSFQWLQCDAENNLGVARKIMQTVINDEFYERRFDAWRDKAFKVYQLRISNNPCIINRRNKID